MNKNRIVMLAVAMAVAAAWGCKGKIPMMSSMAMPLVRIPDNVIDNFEDGNNIMNTNLRGASAGTWTNYGTAGQAVLNTNNYILSNTVGGTNATLVAAHLLGTLVDPGNGSYPEATLQGRFNKAPYYDASSFTGIRYLCYIGTADTATKRRFKVPIKHTVPTSNGGDCATNCWDHFGLNMPTVKGTWVQQTMIFATATREGWGSPIIPATFTGTNLQELIGLDWSESLNNCQSIPSPCNAVIDFWVDEVEFF